MIEVAQDMGINIVSEFTVPNATIEPINQPSNHTLTYVNQSLP